MIGLVAGEGEEEGEGGEEREGEEILAGGRKDRRAGQSNVV